MYFIYLIAFLVLAYLLGSINFAIIITRLVKRIDIREVGTRNPGTANVGRHLGIGWGTVVLAGDLAKGLIPLILAKTFVFTDHYYADYFALFLTGMAAITGHCWPVYHRFRGGAGVATSIGVFMFFIPFEFFIAMLIGFLVSQIFFGKKEYTLGQITPMIFILLTPVIILTTSIFFDTTLFEIIAVGGHPWYIITGVVVLSFYIFGVNFRVVRRRLSKQ